MLNFFSAVYRSYPQDIHLLIRAGIVLICSQIELSQMDVLIDVFFKEENRSCYK